KRRRQASVRRDQAKLGAPSILVNNAGVYSFAPIEAVEHAARKQGAVAAFNGAGGSSINLCTIASVNPAPNSVVYSSSKAAVDTITKALAVELAPKKIPSTRSRRERRKRKGRNDWGRRWRPPRRWAWSCRWGAWASPTTSRAWRFSSRPISRRGWPASALR